MDCSKFKAWQIQYTNSTGLGLIAKVNDVYLEPGAQ
jgi:hypothetical protein